MPDLSTEATQSDWTVPILAVMMFLAPAIGVWHEEMLQDTLKSIVVAMCVLAAALLFFVQLRGQRDPVRWHGLVWLPLALLLYALASMVWSHPFLGGVEAVRWFIFALIVWLGLNTFTRERLPWLAWGIHLGAFVASIWAVLQFWVSFDLFPQGPNPASTFVNRNFFAEFVVCTLPFSTMLVARARQSATVIGVALMTAVTITAILMTGTRAALMGLWIQVFLVLPLILWRGRPQLAWPTWPPILRGAVIASLVATIGVLGVIPSTNPKILEEERGTTAIERGIKRTLSISPRDESLGTRMIMWRATFNVIKARPLQGVGAGAWESEIPLYQAEGSQLETDYYVHNEFLQLVAEYGLVGWAFLALLLGYLSVAGWRVWKASPGPEMEEAPWRAILLCSLLVFLLVSNIGFPWRMASTGALFALCLGGLAASDARLGYRGRGHALPVRWTPALANACVAATVACIALALFITQRAAESERKIVRAAKIALTITASQDWANPRWADSKQQMLQLVREGVAINPHYRKITPMVADELARWGDWRNATWIWESVLGSRPHIVAIMSNAARGYSAMGQPEKALEYLRRARQIQPRATSVRSLEVILLARANREDEALKLAREIVASGTYDYDVVNAMFILAWRKKDVPLAEQAMHLRVTNWPDSRSGGMIQLGNLYAAVAGDSAKALAAFREGVTLSKRADRKALMDQVPQPYRDQVTQILERQAAQAQTSANSK